MAKHLHLHKGEAIQVQFPCLRDALPPTDANQTSPGLGELDDHEQTIISSDLKVCVPSQMNPALRGRGGKGK